MSYKTVVTKEKIMCPGCLETCDAEVWNAGMEFPVFAHECEHCDHLILESEWDPIEGDNHEYN